MDYVRRYILGPPPGTTSAAVIANKNNNKKKNSEYINEKDNRLYHGFGYLSLFSDPVDLTAWSQKENYCNFAHFNRVVDTKTSIIQFVSYKLNVG